MGNKEERKYALIDLLSDGQVHSGEKIGAILKLSRAGVWKLIKSLSENRLEIISLKSQGYKLSKPIIHLDSNTVKKNLSDNIYFNNLNIITTRSLGSTNTVIKQHTYANSTLLLSEEQKTGKGRLGKSWQSPYGQNIAMSLKTSLYSDISELSGISLIVGLAIIQSLQDIANFDNVKLKWPNDVYINNKKVGGILIEVQGEANTLTSLIIGVGLNVNQKPDIENSTSLYQECKNLFDRNIIISSIINNLSTYLENFDNHHFVSFLEEYHKYDFLYGKEIIIKNGGSHLIGIAQGVNSNGHLVIKDQNGVMHTTTSGEASIAKF